MVERSGEIERSLGDFAGGRLLAAASLACCGGNGTAMRRTRPVALGGSLFVVFAAPEAVFAASSTGFAALFNHGAAGAVRPGESFAAVSPAITFAWCCEENLGLAFAHRSLVPVRRSKIDCSFNEVEGGR